MPAALGTSVVATGIGKRCGLYAATLTKVTVTS